MNLSRSSSYQWVYSLTVVCLFSGVLLRSLISFPFGSVSLGVALGLSAVWIALLLSEPLLSRRLAWYFPLYLVIQTAIVFILFRSLEDADFFSVFFALLAMQIMQRFSLRLGILLIALLTPLLVVALSFQKDIGDALALGILYSAVNALLGAYGLVTRRAQDARDNNLKMVQQLQEANQQLQAYSEQIERLAVARERSHLARDLHDSVTQTIFSMTLTTQSASMLLNQNPAQVGPQLEHLNQLAQSALSELQELVSRLNPESSEPQSLPAALRQHLAERHLPEGLKTSLEVLSEAPLPPGETRGLFRIVQEALNNIVKHAHASQAVIRLHLSTPQWIEISDDGQGFDPAQSGAGTGMGLMGMRERAAEIGWILQLTSSPGAGTRIYVEKRSAEQVQP